MVHLWDMEVVNGHLNALHGEKVSAATMLVLLEYKKLADAIRRGTCRVHAFADGDRELLQETFGRKGILGALEKENTSGTSGWCKHRNTFRCTSGNP